ncbi:membrane protein [Bacteroidia bacterium]|nr:membrane protein [Bacteroidia bacterium]GHU71416.1 membrane protein [Bacteroidia bacterium]
MKNYKTHIMAIVSFLFLMSCNNMLDEYPHSAIAPDAVKDSDLPALENGMYNRVQNMPRESFIFNDLMGGLIQGSTHSSAGELINLLTQIENATTLSVYRGYFPALGQVTNVLNVTSKMGTSTLVDKAKGTAHFFRAYIYLNLVTHWGDVPIVERATSELVSRNPAAEVWQFIDRDIDNAIALLRPLDDVGDYYYASQDAALALKARILLYEGKKTEAVQIAEGLIAKPRFALDDFDKIFRKEPNTEIIFAFENVTEESSVAVSELFYNYAHPNKGSWFYRPTVAIPSLFSDEDNRKVISWDVFGGQNCFNKYPSGQTGKDPVILSRIAELYLISAEAQGLPGISRLNELRRKRGLSDVAAPATEDEYLTLILEERTKEFLTEGHRWYDLVRTGRGSEIGLRDAQHLLPIPEAERILNPNLGQNKGY